MPGDLVNVLHLHLKKSDARLILKQISLLEQQRAIVRQLLLDKKTWKEHTGTDLYNTFISHFEEEVTHIEERIRAYERILEAAQRRPDKD
jgi:hypothetical protein